MTEIYRLSNRHTVFFRWFIKSFAIFTAILLVLLLGSWGFQAVEVSQERVGQEAAVTQANFWSQALGRKPFTRDSMGRLAEDISPIAVPNQPQPPGVGGSGLPPEIEDANVSRGLYPGISSKLGFDVFGEEYNEPHTYGKFTSEFKTKLRSIRYGNGAETLTRTPAPVTTNTNPFQWWPFWLGLYIAYGILSFLLSMANYYLNNDNWLDKEGKGVDDNERPPLELLDWRDRKDRKEKMAMVVLAPQAVIPYSLINRQLPHLIPHRTGQVSRFKHLKRRGREQVASRATRAYCKLTRKSLPVSKDPRVRYAHQREHVDKLRSSLEELSPIQRNNLKVKQAFEEVGKVANAYDKLPVMVEDNEAEIVAARVMSDLELLKEAPVTFAKAQHEVLQDELARIIESRPALEAKLNGEKPKD